jgi:hypothetical protein
LKTGLAAHGRFCSGGFARSGCECNAKTHSDAAKRRIGTRKRDNMPQVRVSFAKRNRFALARSFPSRIAVESY